MFLARTPTDALSAVLQSVRLEGAFCLDAEFSAPWCLRGRYGMASVRARLAGAEHVLFFHFVVEGRCKARLADGGDEIELETGDLILFPQDDRHLLGSDLALVPLDTETMTRDDDAGLAPLRQGGGGELTRFVCGYLACNRSLCRPLLDALPRALRIPLGDARVAVLLRELLRAGVDESSALRPGGQNVLARLAELMFVEALRRHVGQLAPRSRGWLAGLRDAQIGRALALLHGRAHEPWTVDSLAREVGLSRSALAERFAALVGEPPMRYLARWRLASAARCLCAGAEAVWRIAERSGYASEAAFNRAFKREFGLPPAAWRKTRAAVQAAG